MSARGYVSTAPRLSDFNGSTWMLAYSRGRVFGRRVVQAECYPLFVQGHRFWKARREAFARCKRMWEAA